jgi:hypothetical protein
MVVQTQERRPGRSGIVGLHIGAVNVQQYFPRHVEQIELELDHLRIVCPLEPSFWEDCPEIHDMRLSLWLESKRSSGKLGQQAAPMVLVPSGECCFRLQLACGNEAEVAAIGPPALAYFAPSVSPGALLDRRKRNTGHRLERRKIARLKSNERPSPAANH